MNPFSYEADEPLHPDHTTNARMTEFEWSKILLSDSQDLHAL